MDKLDRKKFILGGLAAIGAILLPKPDIVTAVYSSSTFVPNYTEHGVRWTWNSKTGQFEGGPVHWFGQIHIAKLIAPEEYQYPILEKDFDRIMNMIYVDNELPVIMVNTRGELLTRESVMRWHVAKDRCNIKRLPCFMYSLSEI